jgi:ribosome maturation factor RimP
MVKGFKKTRKKLHKKCKQTRKNKVKLWVNQRKKWSNSFYNSNKIILIQQNENFSQKIKGQIIKISGDIVGLLVEGSEYSLEFSDIEKASIVF